jgi:autophagy-related protein 13
MASQDKREFDKYLKFLTQKVVQIIVQSREGLKIRTKSNPNDTEWFNLALEDKREVVAQLKRSCEPPYPQHDSPINITISVETLEGDSFPIELWRLSLDASKRDVTVSASQVLYPRFTLLLKSLLSFTRAVPAYQLSRKNQELKFNYVISSSFVEEIFKYEDNVQKDAICEITTSFGLISLGVTYKTSFMHPNRTNSEMVNDSIINTLPLDQDFQSFHSPLNQRNFNSSSSQSQLNSTDGHYPFINFLPKSVPPQFDHTPSSEEPSSFTHDSLATDRQDSDELNSITIQSNQEGYVVLNMQEIKPAYVSDDVSSDLLYLSNDPPFLDMFTEGTDITAAFDYLDKQPKIFSSS